MSSLQYQLNPGASWETVNQLRKACPHLPGDYLAFLLESDGGEGFLGISPGYFVLVRANEVVQCTSDYQLAEYCPGYVAIGSSGGGEVFVFAESGNPTGLFMVPAIGMDPTTALLVTRRFSEFVAAFGGKWPDDERSG